MTNRCLPPDEQVILFVVKVILFVVKVILFVVKVILFLTVCCQCNSVDGGFRFGTVSLCRNVAARSMTSIQSCARQTRVSDVT